jgi:RNAse (barnase) inhibitor barstar
MKNFSLFRHFRPDNLDLCWDLTIAVLLCMPVQVSFHRFSNRTPFKIPDFSSKFDAIALSFFGRAA